MLQNTTGFSQRKDFHAVIDWLDRHWTFFVLLLCLIVQFLAYKDCCVGLPIRADGVGYYIYLPSWFLYDDVSLNKVISSEYQGLAPNGTDMHWNPETGGWQNKFNAGIAILMIPFFLLAHWASWLGYRLGIHAWFPDGYSALYQFGSSVAGSVYLAMGLSILKRVLEKLFARQTIVLSLLAILLGSNVLHYGSGESVMSHSYSFFLIAALMWGVSCWYEKPGSFFLNITLGIIMGLIISVRTVNASAWLLWPLFGFGLLGIKPTILLWWRNRVPVMAALTLCLLAFLPQMYVWRHTFGFWVVNSYGNCGLRYWNDPAIGSVLFSIKKGLFVYTPLTIFPLMGIFALRRTLAPYCVFMWIYLPLVLYVAASATIWYAGGSFGQRYFVESWAFLSVPFCALLDSARRRKQWMINALAVVIIACIAWNLFFMYLYYSREMPFEGLDGPAFFDVFWWRKNAFIQCLLDLL